MQEKCRPTVSCFLFSSWPLFEITAVPLSFKKHWKYLSFMCLIDLPQSSCYYGKVLLFHDIGNSYSFKNKYFKWRNKCVCPALKGFWKSNVQFIVLLPKRMNPQLFLYSFISALIKSCLNPSMSQAPFRILIINIQSWSQTQSSRGNTPVRRSLPHSVLHCRKKTFRPWASSFVMPSLDVSFSRLWHSNF